MRVNVAGDEDPVVKPPAGFRLIRVVTPSSGELEDIASYRRDLESARQFALAYLKSQRDWDDGSRPVDNAFWVAAITMYGRAFASGVRQAELPLDVLNEDQRDGHKFFIDLRNKYIAHSVNSYESSTAFAYITASAFKRPDVTRVGQVHIEATPLDENDIGDFVDVCELLIDALQERIEKLNYDIRGELLAMGPQAVYALPDLVLPADMTRERVAHRRRTSRNRRPDRN